MGQSDVDSNIGGNVHSDDTEWWGMSCGLGSPEKFRCLELTKSRVLELIDAATSETAFEDELDATEDAFYQALTTPGQKAMRKTAVWKRAGGHKA